MERWDEDFEESPKPRNKGGRPKGVRNRTPEQKMLQDKVQELYKRVEYMLDDESKKYFKDAIAGKAQMDPIREAELLLRYLSLYTSAAISWALDKELISQDLGKVIGEYRMGIKDLEDMRRKREEFNAKKGDNERLVDTTRKPTLSRFEDFHGKDTKRRSG